MQISYPTARSMGFRGSPTELLDPLVNLTYAVPYLANAFIIAGKEEDAAVRLYASGYYATAKSRNMLGRLRTAESDPLAPDDGFLNAAAKPVTKLIAAVVEGPQPQQVALAAAMPSATLPGGRQADGLAPEIMMKAGKAGNELPKKWAKDGGMTVIARGEQKIEDIAAFAGPARTASTQTASRGKTKKNVAFAALDLPPSGAQAYASPGADTGDAMQQTAPQAAIAQATAGTDQPAATESPNGKPTRHKATAKVSDVGSDTDTPGKKPAAKHAHGAAKKSSVVSNDQQPPTSR